MLDNEQQPTDAVDPSLPKPPAGRRSRRRPAGPPAEIQQPALEVQAPAEVPAAPPEPEPAAPPQAAEEPTAAAEPTEVAEVTEAPEQAEEPVSAEEPEVEAAAEAEAEQAGEVEQEPESEQLEEIEAAAEHAEEAAADQPDDDSEAEDREESEQGAQSESAPRRRRRRRGGRRRHTSGEAQAEDESDEQGGAESGDRAEKAAGEDTEAEDEQVDTSVEEEDESGAEDSGTSGASRRRRRRRRRRGEDTSTGAEDDPSDVVVKVRDSHPSDDKIHGVEGSTRLEAKRQRRREGRAAGRRRAPIVSESEFLARRESVRRQMVLRQSEELSQIAVLEDGVLVEHYVDRESSSSLIGNIYLGRVQNVLPSMEAAFVDIGRGRNAVLYAGEVDWDAYGAANSDRKIEQVLKSGQQILVQVTKDPVGAKGARLTNHVSIPGRYVVYAPGGHLSGISRKLPDVERKRLKHILADLIEESASVIVRTAAEGATQEQLVHDVSRLKSQWEAIEKKTKQGGAPQLLYSEPDLTIRTVRDLFTEDFAELIIDGHGGEGDAYDMLVDYLEHVAPHLRERVSHWDREARGDVFSHYRLDEQIAKALERKVHLPSGGSLIIDRTEAMTVVDVNTGKFTGHGGNLEATVTANNLEAAEEIVRQLRLRDIGGIIVVDFIDMVLPSNRELLLRRLIECLGRDRTRHQVSEVTSLGLVQMTRKKIGTGLAEAFTEPCEHCNHRGYIVHDMPVATQAPSDGGDRQGRSNRKRNRGKNAQPAPTSSPSPSGNGQATGRGESDKEQPSDEARAAAQAAISAVAHAGSKPRTEAESAALLDDLVAALQEGDAGKDTTSAEGGAAQEEKVEATSGRSRRSGRSRSRRSGSAPAAEAVESVEEQADRTAEADQGEPVAQAEDATAQEAEESAPVARRSSGRSTTRKAAARRTSTRRKAGAAAEETTAAEAEETAAAEAAPAVAESAAAGAEPRDGQAEQVEAPVEQVQAPVEQAEAPVEQADEEPVVAVEVDVWNDEPQQLTELDTPAEAEPVGEPEPTEPATLPGPEQGVQDAEAEEQAPTESAESAEQPAADEPAELSAEPMEWVEEPQAQAEQEGPTGQESEEQPSV